MTRGFGRFLRQNTIALLALFIALGGTTFAAANALPRNSVGTRQLKNNAVTSPKIKNNQVTGADVRESSLGTVPSATNASHATSADSATNATNATNAGNANTLNGLAANALNRVGEGNVIGFVDTPITAAFSDFQVAGDVTITAPAAGNVLVTGVATHSCRGRDAIAHAVDAKLRPTLAPKIIGCLGGIDIVGPLPDGPEVAVEVVPEPDPVLERGVHYKSPLIGSPW